jgi:hypothetical protein
MILALVFAFAVALALALALAWHGLGIDPPWSPKGSPGACNSAYAITPKPSHRSHRPEAMALKPSHQRHGPEETVLKK